MLKKVKLILKSVREYKKYAIITPFFMIGEALLECALPFVMSMFVDTIGKVSSVGDFMTLYRYTNETFKTGMDVSLFWLIITLVGMAIASMICGILGGRTAAKASVGLAANLRMDLYKKIQSFSFGNIDTNCIHHDRNSFEIY